MKIDSFELSTQGSDVSKDGIGDYAFDLFAAPFRGVEGLAQGVYNLGDWATFDLLPDWDERFLGTSKTMPASFLEGAVQFAVPFGAIGKGLSYAGKAAKAGKATGLVGKTGKALTKKGTGKFTDLNFKGYLASEMVTDFVAFDGQEQRLANFIESFPSLQNPVTEYLAADPSDNEAYGRLKNVMEGSLIGAGIGIMLKPFMAGLNAVKRRKAEVAGGADDSDAITSALIGYGDEMKEAPLPKADAPTAPKAPDGDEDIPLGLRRSPIIDPNLTKVDGDAFDALEIKTRKELEKLEEEFEGFPMKGTEVDAPVEFKKKLAAAQDAYSAVELEKFRRQLEGEEAWFIASEFRMLANDTQNSETVFKLALLGETVNKRGIQKEVFAELNKKIGKDENAKEVFEGQLKKAKEAMEAFKNPPAKQIEADAPTLPKTPTKEPTQQPEVKLPNKQTDETVNKVLSNPLNTGGTQAIKRTGSGVMKRSLDGGGHVWESTIDGGLHQGELNALLEAGAEKLDTKGTKPATQSKAKVEEGAILEMADVTGADGDTLKGMIKASGEDRVTQARIANRMYALRSFIGANGEDLINAAELYAKQVDEGNIDEVLEAKIKSMMDTQLHLQARVSELASGFGAGLRSTQFKASRIGLSEKELANQKLRQEYLRQRGGMTINDIVNKLLIAKDGNADDLWSAIAGVNKLVRGVEGGKFMHMVREYYINSLLWGPRTGVINFIGNSISANIRQFERYLGGWMSRDKNLRDGVINSWSYGVFSKELWTFFAKAWRNKDSLLDAGGSTFKGDAGNERAVGAIAGDKVGQAIDRLRGTQGALEGKDALKGAIDWFGNLVRLPSKFLVSTDELYKQMEFRRRAMAQLWRKATDEKGMTNPEDISKYVHDTLEGLVTNSGRHFSEASLIKDAQEVASKQEFKSAVEREKFIADYVEQSRNEKLDFARQQGLVDSDNNINALKQLGDEWVEPNLQSAREATFTNELGPISGAVQKGVAQVPFGYIFLPFIKAPTNILKFSFSRITAPAQYMGGAAAQKIFPGLTKNRDMFIDKLKSADPLVRAEAQGKLAMGVVMQTALITSLYAFKDKITGGGPTDPRQKRVWEAAGHRPYSIKVGDAWVSYQRLDPIATIVGVYADLFSVADDSMHATDAGTVERLMAASAITLARNVTNKSYLTGMEQFMNLMVNPERKASHALGRIAGGFVPNILYQGQSITGNQELKEIRTIGDALYKKLPFLNDRLDLKRNILGEAYEAEMFEAGPSEIINPFNPIAFSTKTGDPILNEMANMHHGFSPPTSKLNGLVDLTSFTQSNGRTAYDRLLGLQSEVKIGKRTLRQTLEKLIASKQYRSLDPRSNPGLPSPRVALIRRVLNRYKHLALQELFREFPDIKQQYIQSGVAKRSYKQGASQESVLSLLNQ